MYVIAVAQSQHVFSSADIVLKWNTFEPDQLPCTSFLGQILGVKAFFCAYIKDVTLNMHLWQVPIPNHISGCFNAQAKGGEQLPMCCQRYESCEKKDNKFIWFHSRNCLFQFLSAILNVDAMRQFTI